jgi:hypothetical protein
MLPSLVTATLKVSALLPYTPCSAPARLALTCATSPSPATQTILSKIPPGDSKLTYAAESILIHYQKTNDVVTMCVAEDSAGRRVPFGFLAELMKRFNAAHSAEEVGDAPAYGMNSFEGDIAKLMVRSLLVRAIVRRAVTDPAALLQKQYEESPPNDPIKVRFVFSQSTLTIIDRSRLLADRPSRARRSQGMLMPLWPSSRSFPALILIGSPCYTRRT